MKKIKIGDDEVRNYLENSKHIGYVNRFLRYFIGEDAPENLIYYVYENYVYSKNFINTTLRRTLDRVVKNTSFVFKKSEGNFVF